MKKLILIALAFVAGCVLMYLFSAFVAWDMDAGNWSQFARYVTANVALVVGLIFSTITFGHLDRR